MTDFPPEPIGILAAVLTQAPALAAGATVYHCFGGFGPFGTEANRSLPVGPSTLKNLRLEVLANTLTAALVITIRVQGVATPITVTVGAGVVGDFSDLVNPGVTAEMDKVSIEFAAAAGAGTCQIGGITLQQYPL